MDRGGVLVLGYVQLLPSFRSITNTQTLLLRLAPSAATTSWSPVSSASQTRSTRPTKSASRRGACATTRFTFTVSRGGSSCATSVRWTIASGRFKSLAINTRVMQRSFFTLYCPCVARKKEPITVTWHFSRISAMLAATLASAKLPCISAKNTYCHRAKCSGRSVMDAKLTRWRLKTSSAPQSAPGSLWLSVKSTSVRYSSSSALGSAQVSVPITKNRVELLWSSSTSAYSMGKL